MEGWGWGGCLFKFKSKVEGVGVAGSYSSFSWMGWGGGGCIFKFELEGWGEGWCLFKFELERGGVEHLFKFESEGVGWGCELTGI